MAAIDSAYHYYLSTYGNSGVSRYDTHKKSQLRAIYNQMVKTNKDTPLYKFKNPGDVKKFAIDVKEHTRSMQNVIASLSDSGEGIESVFHKKIAQSSDENVVSAEFIGQNQDIDSSMHFDVEVRQLAAPQVNLGVFLAGGRHDIKPGSYSFDLTTDLNSYEFQYTVGERDTNRDVQEKLMRLIGSAGVGIKAEIVEDEEGRGALRLESRQTGLSENQNYLFEILPSADSASIRAMRTLGIDNIQQMARNSSFLLNGTEHTSLSNTFTVNNEFELTLNSPSENGSAAQIGFKANADAIADNVQSLVNVYNNLIQLGYDYADTQQSGRLVRNLSNVAKPYYNEFEAYGLQLEKDGRITVDRSLLTDAVTSEDAGNCFTALNHFKDDLNNVAAETSVDPLSYADKVLIAYKNPVHNFTAPYVSSIYSGMMLDRYC